MARLRPIHGRELIRILCNNFGYVVVRQKGSHVTLRHDNTFITVPAKDVGIGLLNRILKDCGIPREEFLKYY